MGSGVTPPGQPLPIKPGEFVGASNPSLLTFNLKDVRSMHGLYIRPEEGLLLTYATIQPSTPLANFTYRLLLPDGTLQVGRFDVQLIADGAFHFVFQQLAEGWLLGVTISGWQGSLYQNGQAFVLMQISRGGTNTSVQGQTLFEGGQTQFGPMFWPGGANSPRYNGPGAADAINQPNPAAGTDWAYAVPAFRRQRIQCLSAQLVASATVANRQVELIIDDGVNVVWRESATVNVTASQTITFSATGTNNPAGINTNDQFLVIPPNLTMFSGQHIRVVTTGLQAGDQWQNIFIFTEEWV